MTLSTEHISVLFLIDKLKNINDFKSQNILEALKNQDEKVQSKDLKYLNLDQDMEEELLKVIRNSQDNLYDLMDLPTMISQEDKIRTISKFDVLYKTLSKIGFEQDAIQNSLRATRSLKFEDHFDHLLINTPQEKIPHTFFDKFLMKDTDFSISIKFNNFNQSSSSEKNIADIKGNTQMDTSGLNNIYEEQSGEAPNDSKLLKPFEKDYSLPDIDAEASYRIMQYVENSKFSASNAQEINEKYASIKFKLTKLEKQIYQKDRGDFKVSDDDVVRIYKTMEILKGQLSSIELDVKFNETKANAILKVKMNNVATERRIVESKRKRAQNAMKNQKQSKIKNFDATEWQIMSFDSKVVKRMCPKDILVTYCKKKKLGTPVLKTENIGPGIWRSSVKMQDLSSFNKEYEFDLPSFTGASTKEDAKQLISMHALFKLDCDTSMYKVLPQCYKDLWVSWARDKSFIENFPTLEADRKRIEFLIDMVNDQSLKNQESNITCTDEAVSNKYVIRHQFLRKKQLLFDKMKRIFKKRYYSDEYMDMEFQRNELPVRSYKFDILQLVQENKFVIISGQTGSGKSTQIPQYLAEQLLMESYSCGSVICTQPRRISTISIANRVSNEMCDKAYSNESDGGYIVGYNVRFKNKSAAENVLLFYTPGILLRKLERDPFLTGVTHVVIDEVHERTIEIDFLLLVLKKLCDIRDDLKVILMSATAETKKFSQYFGGCPVLNIPGRTYPVMALYLEDVIRLTGYTNEAKIRQLEGSNGARFNKNAPVFDTLDDENDVYSPPGNSIDNMDLRKVNYGLILHLLLHITSTRATRAKQSDMGTISKDEDGFITINRKKPVNDNTNSENEVTPGAILIFLPGMSEIRDLLNALTRHRLFGDKNKFVLVALHSSVTSENQEKAFEVPENGITKIILSTNIAETGITISDITVVIDTGMARVVSYDKQRQLSQLQRKFIAKANVLQRRGRAGRLREGTCYHLFTEEIFNQMDEHESPEILRLPLEEICLRVKVCNMGNIKKVLFQMIDHPDEHMIDTAVKKLQDVQALTNEEVLTPLGVHLANLPLDVHLGKMIIFGAIFRCLDPILTIAAALTQKTPFTRPLGEEIQADAARSRFKTYDSDFLTIYRAYTVWKEYYLEIKANNSNAFTVRQVRNFCRENYLSYHNLEVIEDIKRQYLNLLVSIGFVTTKDGGDNLFYLNQTGVKFCQVPQEFDTHSDSIQMINAAITAGLYPKVAQVSSKCIYNKKFELNVNFSSVLYGRNVNGLTDFVVYNNAIVSGYGSGERILMWEVSWMDTVLAVLFSNDIQIKHKNGYMIIDDWVTIKCSTRTCVLLKLIRRKLSNCLEEKMQKPDLNLNVHNKELMDLLVSILESV